VRIADTILRGGHISEQALVDAWQTGVRPAHLDHCEICADRAIDLARWLAQTRQLGLESADAVFTPERLAAQQSQILRKLEQLDRPSKLLSFPRATAPLQIADTQMPVRHSTAPWIAVAAACLMLGVVAGRLSVWTPAPPKQAAQQSPAIVVPPATAPSEPTEFLGEITRPELNSLSALETLTPQVGVVARASDGPRR
jgi:hypothetical protein